MKVHLLAGVAAAGLLTAGAAAADPNGWYGAIDAGYNFWSDDVQQIPSDGTGPGLSIEVEDDFAGFARLGYRFTPNWRVELEGGYRAGDLGAVSLSSGALAVCNTTPATGACENPEGEHTASTLMMNVIYDFGSADSRFRPFIGLGAGVNRVNTELVGTLAANRAVGVSIDDSSTELAAQGIAGLAFALSDRASMDLTYRYLVSNSGFDTFTSTPATALGEYQGRYEYVHTVTLGLRYAFGADEAPPPPPPPPPPPYVPPPPPPPPPAPVQQVPQAREFVVYFDWDRSDLTAEASSVVTQAANYAKSGRPTRVLIVGHADTSGSAAYNVGLSNRRARTVADALVSQGVNGGVISLDGKGETALARPTADGVREPLNRRATIGINF